MRTSVAGWNAMGRINWMLWAVLFAIAYVSLLALGNRLIALELGLVPVGLAAGLAVGCYVRAGRQLRVAILAVQLLAGLGYWLGVGLPVSLSLLWSSVVAIECVAAGLLLVATGTRRIQRWEHLAALVGVAVAVALVAATAAAASALLTTEIISGPIWRTWWVSTAAGIVLATPAVLAARMPRMAPTRRRLVELGAASAIAIFMILIVFGGQYSDSLRTWGAQYLLIPLLLWFAVRFGLAITSGAVCVLNIVALNATMNGYGALAEQSIGARSMLTFELGLVLVVLVIYAVAINQEQRRLGEAQLSAAHGLVDSLLANSDAMISIREYGDNSRGIYTLANPRFARSVGRPVQDVVGRTDVDLLATEDAVRETQEDLQVLAAQRSQVFITRSPIDTTAPDRARGVHLVTKFPVTEATGEVRAVGSIALDITDHRRREQLMRLTFDQSPVPMARLAWRDGQAGEVLDANQSLAEVLGVPAVSMIGGTLDRFVHPDERGVALISAAGPAGAPRRREARMAKHDGEELWVAVTATVVEPTAGQQAVGGGIDEAFALVVLEDMTARRVAELTLTHQARHDSLTGVLNRYALMDRLESALRRLWRDTWYVAVLFCDLDGFKHLNDTLGHRAGDQMLVSVSERLRAVMNPQDTVARLGGDEFVLICEDLTSPGQARIVGERIREAMRAPFRIDSRDYGITVSVGIATTTDPHTQAGDLLRRADLAMYRAKDGGRNRVEYYVEELETKVVARVEATETLRRALTEDRIRVHYQPIVDLPTGKIVGVEALARLIDDSGALLLPSSFIDVAESSGLVVPLGEQVLDIALDHLRQWGEQGIDLQLNVNVSPRQLSRASFAPAVFERLVSRGLTPDSLCLEITEGAVVDATGPTLITLRRLRSYGVHVGIDDFGTGYSSLTTLKYLPADVIKVDRSFVEGLGEDPADAAIVGAVVRVAHDLGRMVVAEGVETIEQEQELRIMGCDQVQGFRYGRPVPPEDAIALARTGLPFSS